MGNAGRVLMIPKGDYNAATTYERLDFVYYQGRSYVCKQTSTGNAPTNTTYWQALTGDASAEIQALTNEVRGNWATGGKNVLPITISSQTRNGITLTVNDDKSITVSTAAGGATESTAFTISEDYSLEAGTYIYSGVPATGSSTSTYYLDMRTDSGSQFFIDSSRPAREITTVGQSGNDARLVVESGVIITTPIVLKPMIRLASITDPTYQPYAKTNVELTQNASWLTSAKTYYDANTDATVKQNHYNVAKYFYDFIKVGESHTIIVRYEGGYYDTMILSKDNGTGLYCVDFCQASGLGKILYFRYNGSNDTFADIFSIT